MFPTGSSGGPGRRPGSGAYQGLRSEAVAIEDPGGAAPVVFNTLLGEARKVRSTPFGDVGTVFSGQGIEVVWVSKMAEQIDQNWFSSDQADLILVVQG
jgi:hypothetical protein